MLQYNSQDAKQLEDLTKFARFITKQFGVQIVFESAQAKADNQNTIYLPSIVGLNARDCTFLRLITLHEVGHIKYTNYKAPANLIKTEYHFRLINAVEDARIENLLMSEYDGAHDMFESLYNDFAADRKYMQKIFGFDPTQCDLWYFLGVYLHDYLVKISPKPSLSKLYGRKNANKINDLVKKLNLEEYLKKVKLKTWNDAVEIATEVYNRFIKSLKDGSKKIDVEKAEEAKTEIKKALNTSKNKVQKAVDDIDEALKQLFQMKPAYDKANAERLEDLESAREERNKLSRRISNTNHQIKEHEKSSKKSIDAQKALNKKEKYEKEAQKLQNILEDLQQINTSDLKKQNKLQKKRDNIKNKLKTRESQITKQEKFYQERKEIADQYSKLTSDEVKALKEKLKDLNSDYKDICKEINDHSELTQIEKDYLQQVEKKNVAEKKIHTEILDSLQKIQKEVTEHNMPAMEGMPGYEANEEWQDSDKAQQEFDKRASEESGKVIINGRIFPVGSGRDILALIDKSINDVKDFNVLDHFAESTTDDKLKNFNDINNTTIFNDETHTDYIDQKHIPLTTEFDRVVYKENSNGQELVKIYRKNKDFIDSLKSVFKNRLKFNRRDMFKANQEDGKLDTRDIWRIAANIDSNDTRFFERIVPKFINKNVATIAIDISGSHDKAYTNYGERIRELTYAFSEALKEVHIDHDVVGLHAPVSQEMREQNAASIYNRRSNFLETVVYKKAENSKNFGIQNVEIECADNSDGESLRLIGKNLLKRGNKSKMIFLITDGKPFLSDANLNILDSDLIRTIEWLKASGIKLFVFGFNHDPKKFYKTDFCEIKHYNDVLSFCNVKL